MDKVREALRDVFRRVFDEDDLEITDATTAVDVDGWDSMAHVNLILAIEKQFRIKFSSADLVAIQGQDVGGLARIVAAKAGGAL